jgi:hypothetical protein
MDIVRLFSGDDGQSHLEDLDPASRPDLMQVMKATSVRFRLDKPNTFVDWHNAPKKQWVITLMGEYEIGLGDGSVRRFGPGTASLAMDSTGQGHTTRIVSPEGRLIVTVPLADDEPFGGQ